MLKRMSVNRLRCAVPWCVCAATPWPEDWLGAADDPCLLVVCKTSFVKAVCCLTAGVRLAPEYSACTCSDGKGASSACAHAWFLGENAV